jgi:tetratricopeptide (TPR) repeat protein
MMKKIVFVCICFFLAVSSVWSQEEPDTIALNEDEFQENFYEALKQKGIENYDKAIIALEKCLTLQPNNPVVFFELGKNYFDLKNYQSAQNNLEKATQLDAKNRWYWVGLYDVAYQQKDFNTAIKHVQKLIEFKPDYKEDLVALYMYTSQFDKALVLINELNETVGKSESRDQFKSQILTSTKYQGLEKDKLLEAIKKNPKDENNYVALIYLYSESNQEDKALEIAKKLEKEIPNSDWAQVSLFKFHLNNNDGDKAALAMEKVFKSVQVDKKIKHRILNEFLIFAKNNPKYNSQLESAIQYFKDDKEVKIAKEIGKFYQNRQDWNTAIRYYEIGLKSNPDDLENRILLLLAYSENEKYDALAQKSEESIELYPLQPEFYYYAGLGFNQLKNFKKAKDLLETGMDYIVDNKKLEVNYYVQLGEAYNGLGDTKKKEFFFQKAEKLLKEIK